MGLPRPPRRYRYRFPSFLIVVRWAGLVIVIYETVFEHIDRPSLLILAGGMMGLHSVVKAQNGD